MSACPNCGKTVDPLRAPAVTVRDGKVLGYCSKECAAAAETKPTKVQPAAAAKPARATSQSEETGKRVKPGMVAIPTTKADLDSNPVIEIVHEPASGVVTSAADARSGRTTPLKRSQTDGAIQIADTGHLDDFVSYDEPERSRVLLVVLLLLFVIAGAAAGAYYLGYLDKLLGKDGEAAAPPPQTKPEPPPVTVDAAPAMTPQIALDKAQLALRLQLGSDSPRVQRVAASALARTGDKEAIELLAKALKGESSYTAKLDIAYALARGGDKRGIEALTDAMQGSRDQKLEAGRRLALLGDKRAIGVLEDFLHVVQFKLGVSEQLAYIAEPRAIEILEKVRADEKAVPDERARATIALGHAGRADVAPALRELLADDRQNSFAAAALAGMHDEAARPVLVKQLAIPSLRVQSARALRRLDAKTDMTPLLPALVTALDSNKDTEQVQIAEAILLLAGPATWSERE